MGLFDRVERRLERAVNGAFARAFKAEVQPVEIASAIRRAMDDRAAVVGQGRTVVPNAFSVELASTDHTRFTEYEEMLTTELVASAQEHAESQGYTPGGPLFVEFVDSDDLETGVFRIRPTTNRKPAPRAPGARRPRGHHPRNEHFMPQAISPAEGNVGLAGHAAAAAAGAAAGTAAAARAGHLLPEGDAVPPGYTDGRRTPADDHDRRVRDAQREQDLAAWPAEDDAVPAPPPVPQPHEEAPSTRRAPVEHESPFHPPRSLARRVWLELGVDSYPLLSAITVLGRDPGADISLDDPGISRRHCEIRVTNDGPRLVMSIRDLGSTNGTFVNGERITSARIESGDRITVGRSSLSVRTGDR